MKKIIFPIIALALMISACATPQLIATSTPIPIPNTSLPTSTATTTPLPTATLVPSATPTEVPVIFDAQTLAAISPEQIMASVPEMAGYEKQYPAIYYVHYVNANGELGASYNLETGGKVEMPENLKTLAELPTKIENADSYPEVDVKNLDAFVAWIHFKYDAQAKDLKPYPFVENELIPDQEIIFGSAAFFQKIENPDAHIDFLGMAKLMEKGEPIFWSDPRMIRDGQGNLRVQLSVDSWGDELNSTVTGNDMYSFKNRQAVKEGFQIAKFDKSDPTRACTKYNLLPMYTDRFAGCMTYLEKYYRRVETEVKSLIGTGAYSQKLEELPIIFRQDAEPFNL